MKCEILRCNLYLRVQMCATIAWHSFSFKEPISRAFSIYVSHWQLIGDTYKLLSWLPVLSSPHFLTHRFLDHLSTERTQIEFLQCLSLLMAPIACQKVLNSLAWPMQPSQLVSDSPLHLVSFQVFFPLLSFLHTNILIWSSCDLLTGS